MKLKTRADKARHKVDAIICEVTKFTGERPKIVRVNGRDMLALVECGHVVDDKLRNASPEITVKIG